MDNQPLYLSHEHLKAQQSKEGRIMSIKQELVSPSNWTAAGLLLAFAAFAIAVEVFHITLPFLSSPSLF